MNALETSPENAAAELFVRSISQAGMIDTAWRKEGTNVVCATTHGHGFHLYNQATDYDADVHLVCETDAIEGAGNLPDDVPLSEHGPVYFNVKVHGVKDDATGNGLPTHVCGNHGAHVNEDMSDELRALAEAAGVDLTE